MNDLINIGFDEFIIADTKKSLKLSLNKLTKVSFHGKDLGPVPQTAL